MPEPVGEIVPRPEVAPAASSAGGRSSPSRTSGSRPRSASRRRARSTPPSPLPGARAPRRARGRSACPASPRARSTTGAPAASASASSMSALEIGGALPRDAVEEIERDVVKPGITQIVQGAPDVVRRRPPLEHVEELRLEALRAERDPVHAGLAKQPRERRRHRLRVRLDRDLAGSGQRGEQPRELARLGERRRPAAEVHRLERLGESSRARARARRAARRRRPCPPSRPTTVTKSQ